MRLIDADALGVGRCSRNLLPADYCAGWNGLIRLIEKAPPLTLWKWCGAMTASITSRMNTNADVISLVDYRM